MSLYILLFSSNNLASLKASMFPSVILFNKDMEGNGKSPKSNLYDFKDEYRSSNVYCITSLE